MWRGRGRQPQTLGNAQPRHRSESRCLDDRQCSVKTAARKRDHCPGALHEGDPVQVFSRSADKWVDGEVVKLADNDFARIEYEIGEYWYGKIMHIHSDHLATPMVISDEDVALNKYVKHTDDDDDDDAEACGWRRSFVRGSHGRKKCSDEETYAPQLSSCETEGPYVWTASGLEYLDDFRMVSEFQNFEIGGQVTQKDWDKLEELARRFQRLPFKNAKNALDLSLVELMCPVPGEDILDFYLRLPEVRAVPVGYVREGPLLRHLATDVRVLAKLVPLCPGFQSGEDVLELRGDIVLYHYCAKEAFDAISSSMTLQASTRLDTDCDFGVGQYATQRQPHKFADRGGILYNNYPRATAKYRPGEHGFPSPDRVGFCIPISARLAWTPAFPLTDRDGKRGRVEETRDRHGDFNAEHHDIWVVRTELCNVECLHGGLAHQTWLPNSILPGWDQCNISLFRASQQGQCNVVVSSLKSHADVNAVGMHKITALHIASAFGKPQVVRQLLDFRARIEARCLCRPIFDDHFGFGFEAYDDKGPHSLTDKCLSRMLTDFGFDDAAVTPLHMAACAGNLEVVQNLVHARADLKRACPVNNQTTRWVDAVGMDTGGLRADRWMDPKQNGWMDAVGMDAGLVKAGWMEGSWMDAVDMAKKRGNEEVVEFLLRCDES